MVIIVLDPSRGFGNLINFNHYTRVQKSQIYLPSFKIKHFCRNIFFVKWPVKARSLNKRLSLLKKTDLLFQFFGFVMMKIR